MQTRSGVDPLAQKLVEIFQAPTNTAAQATPMKIIADERTNKLVVVAGDSRESASCESHSASARWT